MTALQRFKSLDGLRGVAAVVVVLHHCVLTIPAYATAYTSPKRFPGTEWLVNSPLYLVVAGQESVLVFFVLSGFVLALPGAQGRIQSWRVYYPSRLLRLYLPVWGALVVALICAAIIPRVASPAFSSWINQHDETITPIALIRDAVLVTGTTQLDSPLWSLQWEMIFSLLLPIYILIGRLLSRIWAPGVAAALVASAIGGYFHIAALQYLPIFAVGTLLAYGGQGRMSPVTAGLNRAWVGRVALAVGLLLLCAGPLTRGILPDDLVRLFTPLKALGATILVVIAAYWAPAAQLLASRPLAFLGKISFSMYLVHEPVVVSLAIALPQTIMWAVFPLSILIAGLLTLAFFHLVELPCHRLSRRCASVIAARINSARRSGRPLPLVGRD